MTDIQGALGSSQMDKANYILDGRTKRAHRYDELLKELPWLRPPRVPENAVHGYQSYVCLFAPEAPSMANVDALHDQRNEIMLAAEELGVSTRQGTHAIHGLGYYQRTYGYGSEDMPKSWMAEHLTMTLPLYPQMTDAEQDYVVDVIKQTYAAVKR